MIFLAIFALFAKPPLKSLKARFNKFYVIISKYFSKRQINQKMIIKWWPCCDIFSIKAIFGQIYLNYLTFQYSGHQFLSILLLYWEILNKTLNYAKTRQKYWLHFGTYTEKAFLGPKLFCLSSYKVIEGWFQYILCDHLQIFC